MSSRLLQAAAVLLLAAAPMARGAETCTTQSKMTPEVREKLRAAAITLALAIQAGDASVLRVLTDPALQANFSGVSSLVASTSPLLKGQQPIAEQLYVLDSTSLTKTAEGANPDAQFYCSLNNSQYEADFSIPQLPPSRYAFAMIRFDTPVPYRVSMLLRDDGGSWKLAGLYPRALAATGHEGLWFWQQARTFNAAKQPWTAWLYLQEAQQLLTPAGFVSSSHLEKLSSELATTAPTAVSGGISVDAPLVLKAAAGAEYRFTSMVPDTSLGPDKLDIAAHLAVETLGDNDIARKRNVAAMAVLLAAHPEYRQAFHGIWIITDAPDASPYGTELPMAEIH